jgi:predicted dehydrogenase/threonine dehydrogenase-like Zn-dependent dehydrogenase
MKQVLQNMSSGETSIIDAPAPSSKSGEILIESTCSLISAGTERMLVDFGKASLISKAKQQPDKVKMVLDKVKTDGLATTIDAVKSKLAQPLPLGYCNVGRVKDIGRGVGGFAEGDRVISNGSHADVVRVPQNLVAKIPDNVDDESAAFTVLAAIGLQGIRLIQPTLGESFVVTGVGLIGLAAVQLLRAHGCRVLAIDFDQKKLDLARTFGAEICNPGNGEDPIAAGMAFSRSRGVDGVVITASTKSNEVVAQAAKMSRKRGRIVLVGVVGLELSRADFYEKELSFQVSCSYGPGRYEENYEGRGMDYPIGFVRWTEQRNFEAILDMLSTGQLNFKPLISHRYSFDDAKEAYNLLTNDKSALGILLQYSSENQDYKFKKELVLNEVEFNKEEPVVGFIGAGNYASRMLIPAFKKAGAQLSTIVTTKGVSGVIHGEKNEFHKTSTDLDAMLDDETINTIAIVTRHNSHAMFVDRVLKAKKNAFVEKPIALSHDEINQIETTWESIEGKKPHVMVGYNRRFSPHIQKMKSLLGGVKDPISLILTMNAGAIPANHWTQDPEVGGGRILGEACHFIDLARFIVGSPIVSVQARCMGRVGGMEIIEDKAAIILGFEDGSIATIQYFANGAASFPKERIEVFAENKVLQLDNFIKLTGYGWSGFSKDKIWSQDKGQDACAAAFLEAIKSGGETPIPMNEILEVARISVDIAEQLRNQG